MLPQIAKLYCVTINDLYKETSIAYENYAHRLGCIYEATHKLEDFLSADIEYKKLLSTGTATLEDYRMYGILHQIMLKYCIDKARSLFEHVLKQEPSKNAEAWMLKALTKFPNNPALFVYGGDSYLDADYLDAQYSKGFCFEEMHVYEKAYEIWFQLSETLRKKVFHIKTTHLHAIIQNCEKHLTP